MTTSLSSQINLNFLGKLVCINRCANIARIIILHIVKSIVPTGTERYDGYQANAAMYSMSPYTGVKKNTAALTNTLRNNVTACILEKLDRLIAFVSKVSSARAHTQTGGHRAAFS